MPDRRPKGDTVTGFFPSIIQSASRPAPREKSPRRGRGEKIAAIPADWQLLVGRGKDGPDRRLT